MKLAMGQMSISPDMQLNLQKTVGMISRSTADLIFFPEIQLTPFFPQYRREELERKAGMNPDTLALPIDDPAVLQIREACRKHHRIASPNLYIRKENSTYDMSLMIGSGGSLIGDSAMVHIFQGKQFYEQDYYTPSDSGFRVYQFPFGAVGVVICFDRHLPESIRSCAAQGAQLVIIPTANTVSEPMELFEWELRVQAWQNNVFIAMCNRVGTEGEMTFSGQSILVSPDGEVLLKADDTEQLIEYELDLTQAAESRARRPYIGLRRPSMYKL